MANAFLQQYFQEILAEQTVDLPAEATFETVDDNARVLPPICMTFSGARDKRFSGETSPKQPLHKKLSRWDSIPSAKASLMNQTPEKAKNKMKNNRPLKMPQRCLSNEQKSNGRSGRVTWTVSPRMHQPRQTPWPGIIVHQDVARLVVEAL